MKKVAVLGSTGSIGRSALDVISAFPDRFRAVALAAGRSVERLADQIVWLRQYGVSDAVIREMQMTAARLPRRVYVEGPVYQPAPVMVIEEPRPVIGVGVGFGCGRRW